ncbi:MAG: M15 family metallopeptidase [Clostridium sp.]
MRKSRILGLMAVLVGSMIISTACTGENNIENSKNKNNSYVGEHKESDSERIEKEKKEKIEKEKLEKEKKEQNELEEKKLVRSKILLANKENQLKDDFVPENLTKIDFIEFPRMYASHENQMDKEAVEALRVLIENAKAQGIRYYGASGYRSYESQEGIYNSNVQTFGLEHASKYVAKPGTSEHQTGLAIDITNEAGIRDGLVESFAETVEGKWLANNAYIYGFIVRYPNGKEDITGYAYEPWHIRYVGKDIAMEITEENLTLEEYIGLYK